MIKILNNKIAIVSILVVLSLIIIALSSYVIYSLNNEEECFCDYSNNAISMEENSNISESIPIYVEIKGAVNNPGVFEVKENTIINDVINLAGGLTEDAYTDNINLSKKVSDELVIYVFTKNEYKKNLANNNQSNQTNSSQANNNADYKIDDSTKNNISIITSDSNNLANSEDTTTKLININIATIAELTELPGIGESKATNIINYRTENGYFKTIEDLKNVSGIGDATFEQLKDYITV